MISICVFYLHFEPFSPLCCIGALLFQYYSPSSVIFWQIEAILTFCTKTFVFPFQAERSLRQFLRCLISPTEERLSREANGKGYLKKKYIYFIYFYKTNASELNCFLPNTELTHRVRGCHERKAASARCGALLVFYSEGEFLPVWSFVFWK